MKKTEKDYEYLETSPEMRSRGMRRITRPAHVDKILQRQTENKERITIYLDALTVAFYKRRAEETGEGYQTLINRALRATVGSENFVKEISSIAIGSEGDEVFEIFKKKLLNDKSFLHELAEAIEG